MIDQCFQNHEKSLSPRKIVKLTLATKGSDQV